MSTLSVYYDDAFLDHEPPGGNFILPSHELLAVEEPHPDVPARIRNIRHAIEHALGDVATWNRPTAATREQLERVHSAAYLDELRDLCESGGGRLTPETGVNEATYEAARIAAGASVRAAEEALEGGIETVPYALVRPSGHHAQPTTADGFCYVNNAAVAAEHAVATGRADRAAIVDWDVHHGNGTQECFYDRDDVLVVSLHNDFGVWGTAHPQTGAAEESGDGEGEGYTVNVPLAPGTGDRGYEYAFETIVEPVIAEYDPDLLLISAGGDPGHLDPMAPNLVSKDGFEALGRRAHELAVDAVDGRLGVIQEGGYRPSHLAFAMLGTLEGILGVETEFGEPFFVLGENLPEAEAWVDEAAAVHERHWSLDR